VEGRGKDGEFKYCQVGRDEQMSWNQPEELTEQMSSEVSLDQHVQLTEEEDLRDLLMIGGIQVFLPFSQGKVEVCVVEGATTEAEQSVVTVRKEEELEQTLEAAQEEGGNEHSEEWINDFGQGAEKKEVATLKIAAKEDKEQAGRVITPWEMELEMLEDWLNNPEPARELTEVELSGKVTE
jgi:hypothetical protein